MIETKNNAENIAQAVDVDYVVRVSYLEIYNEQGFDLLDPRSLSSAGGAAPAGELPRVSGVQEDDDGCAHGGKEFQFERALTTLTAAVLATSHVNRQGAQAHVLVPSRARCFRNQKCRLSSSNFLRETSIRTRVQPGAREATHAAHTPRADERPPR